MKNSKSVKIFSSALMTLSAAVASAQTVKSTEVNILPMAGPNMNDVVVDSQMEISRGDSGATNMDIYTSCYGTNLRSVANPISPKSTVTAYIGYVAKNGQARTVKVAFPAGAAMKGVMAGGQDLSSTTEVRDQSGGLLSETVVAKLQDNMIRLQIKNTMSVSMDVLATGTDYGKLSDIAQKSTLVNSVRFVQTMPPGAGSGKYMGSNGALTASIRWYASETGKNIKVYAAFPGENGFCGGYFSPLVLNFHEDFPVVGEKSRFALYEKDVNAKKAGLQISWPSFKKESYFLALDLNGNGRVDHGGELFGDINGYKDAYANLAVHDSNGDKVIDEKDPVFKRLKLWRDKNHDGVCQKSELIPLSQKGVVSISLEHKDELRYISDAAKVLGPGSFSYKNKEGLVKTGYSWDIFLSSVP